jgi:CHAT domain-containing protein
VPILQILELIRDRFVHHSLLETLVVLLSLPFTFLISASTVLGQTTPENSRDAVKQEAEKKLAGMENKSLELFDQGRIDEAIQLNRERLALARELYPHAEHPNGHPQIANALLSLACALRTALFHDEAQQCAAEAMRIAEKLDAQDSTAASQELLADCYMQLGNLAFKTRNLDGQEQYYRKATAIYSHLLDTGTTNGDEQKKRLRQEQLLGLNLLARTCDLRGELAEAKKQYEQLTTHWELRLSMSNGRPVPGELEMYLEFLGDFGDLHCRSRQFAEGIEMHQRATELARNAGPELSQASRDARLSHSLLRLARAHNSATNFIKAEQAYSQAIEIVYHRHDAEEDAAALSMLVVCLTELAQTKIQLADTKGANETLLQLKKLSDRLYENQNGKRDAAELAVRYSQIGAMFFNLDQVHEARGFFEKALEIRRELAKKGTPQSKRDLSVSLFNLSSVYKEFSEESKAVEYAMEGLTLQRELYPSDKYPDGNREFASALQTSARILSSYRMTPEAIACGTEAVDMWRRLTRRHFEPGDHNAFSIALQFLADLRADSGNQEESLRLLDEATALYDNLGEQKAGYRREIAMLEARLAIRLASAGKLEEAAVHSRKSLELCNMIFGPDQFPDGHPTLAFSWSNFGQINYAAGKLPEAADAALKAVRMGSNCVDKYIAGLAESEALNYAASGSANAGLLISAWTRSGRPAADLYAALWQQRGTIQRMLSFRQRMLRSASAPAAIDALKELHALSQQLAGRLLKSNVNQTELVELNRRKEELERELAAQIPEFTTFGASHSTPAELASCIPEDLAFVDVIRFADAAPNQTAVQDITPSREIRYAAFVVQRGRPVAFANLGNAEEIDLAVNQWRQAIEDRGPTTTAGVRLRSTVWEPIERLLQPNISTIYVAPESGLSRIAWAAMPSGNGGSYLLEKYAFAIVPSGHHLLEQIRGKPPAASAASRVLLVGDIDFANAVQSQHPLVSRSALGLRGGSVWPPLPGSKQEINQLTEIARDCIVVRLSGNEATSTRVSAELANTRWAHFATHGYFAASLAGPTGKFGRERVSVAERSPMLLSGLVLSGANRLSEKSNSEYNSTGDAILTAEAISYLPMDGMELAVLSACDTGLGDVARGEGVLGLQRAFHIAGARNVVASLWKVEDQAAADLMTRFYRRMWQENQSPLAALRESQLEILRSVRDKEKENADGARGVDLSKSSPIVLPAARNEPDAVGVHESIWAAFVLSGIGR